MQSKTIFGGMENASAIFYAENTVTGDRKSEDLLAHEIAHQWFGNMATEKSFAHLWLSEGFATYLTDVYLEKKYGKEAFHKRLQEEREQVIKYNRVAKNSVVDSSSELMELLNANSYQKGAWVLHMLRGETGDAVFQKIIQTYYDTYKGGNADTRDFQAVAEKMSGKNLKWFFDQWLYRPGHPKLKIQWSFADNKVNVNIQQTGENIFQFPLEIAFVNPDGKQSIQKVMMSTSNGAFSFAVGKKPAQVVLDPATALLFEGSISESR